MPINSTTNSYAGGDQIDCSLFLFILYGIICGIVCIIGFAGNILSFFVLVKDQASPVACFLLQSLAVADNCFLALWCVHYSIRQFYIYFAKTTTPIFMYIRLYTFPILYMAQMQTIWLTVIIALNRFMAVCLPYQAPQFCSINNVYKEVFTVTLFSIVYNIPKYFEITITHNGSVTWCYTAMGSNAAYRMIYNDIMYYLFTFVLPLLILAVVNTKVIITFRAIRRRKQRMTSRRRDNDNNITLVMIIVVVVFMVCQAPARIVQIVYKYYFTSCMQPAFFLIHISNTFEVLNSSVNFIIYAIFRKRFCAILSENVCLDLFTRQRALKRVCTTTEGLQLTEHEETPPGSKRKSNPTDSTKGNRNKQCNV